MLPIRIPFGIQPTDERIDWSHPRAAGLAFASSLSSNGVRDLVSGQAGTLTGLTTSLPVSGGTPLVYRQFGTSSYADFTKPAGIGATTPFTVAWTQEPRSTSAYSTIIHVNFGTAGVHWPFPVYQSATDANYYFAAGPSSGTHQARWATAIGVVTNNRLDRYVLRCAGGSQSTTLADYTLYRNGQLVTRDGTGVTFGGATTGGFRIGALLTGSDPWEGLIGDLRLWSRVLSEAEAADESRVEQSLVLYEPQRIWVPVSAGGGNISIDGNVGAATAAGTAGQVGVDITVSGNVGAATAAGTTAQVGVAIDIAGNVGAATAAGTAGQVGVDITVSGNVGAATAAGTSAQVGVAIDIAGSVGAATAAGTTAGVAVDVTVAGSVGNAVAAGITGGVDLGGNISIDGTVGAAVAAGVQGLPGVGITVNGSVGAASAAGTSGTVSLGNDITINGSVGSAAAAGILASLALEISLAGSVGNATAAGVTGTVTLSGADVFSAPPLVQRLETSTRIARTSASRSARLQQRNR